MIKKKKLVLMGILAIAVALVMGLTSLPGITGDSLASASETILEEENESCTSFCVTGRAAWDGKTRLGGSLDNPPRSSMSIKLTVNEETGIKVLWDSKPDGGLNSYGVGQKGGGRPGPPGSLKRAAGWADKDEGCLVEIVWLKRDYPGLERFDRQYVLEHARSVKEAVAMCIENLPEGTYDLAPTKDAARAWSNFFLSPSGVLQWANVRKEYSENRAERIQELLDERSWLKSTSAQGEISTGYCFNIFRDRRFPYDAVASYDHDNRGNISRWGHIERTANAHLMEIPKEYTDLLSIYFTTPNFPPTGPFLPFYIGITEVPKTFADGPTNETHVFQELLMLYPII